MKYSVESLLTQYRDDVSTIRHLLKNGEHNHALMKLTVLESSINTALATVDVNKKVHLELMDYTS